MYPFRGTGHRVSKGGHLLNHKKVLKYRLKYNEITKPHSWNPLTWSQIIPKKSGSGGPFKKANQTPLFLVVFPFSLKKSALFLLI